VAGGIEASKHRTRPVSTREAFVAIPQRHTTALPYDSRALPYDSRDTELYTYCRHTEELPHPDTNHTEPGWTDEPSQVVADEVDEEAAVRVVPRYVGGPAPSCRPQSATAESVAIVEVVGTGQEAERPGGEEVS